MYSPGEALQARERSSLKEDCVSQARPENKFFTSPDVYGGRRMNRAYNLSVKARTLTIHGPLTNHVESAAWDFKRPRRGTLEMVHFVQ
jgi:hypothetical protein